MLSRNLACVAWLVCYTAVFSVVTQRSSPRDENGCEADYGIDLLQVDLLASDKVARGLRPAPYEIRRRTFLEV